MNILTPENVPFNVNMVGDVAPEEMYCTLDLMDMSNTDYFFHDLMYMVTFLATSVELEIGNYTVEVPLNTQLLMGDEETGMMEMIAVDDILTVKEPHLYCINPLKSKYPFYLPVKIKKVFTKGIKWHMPLIPKKNLLAIPIENKNEPLCIFMADENDRIPDFVMSID